MNIDRYFDNAATTPVDPRVVEEMLPFFAEEFGNSESIHAFGQRAHQAVELARERVASLLGAEDPSQIVFTSGATESCNWVIRNFDSGWISPFEHSAVREPALASGFRVLENKGWALSKGDGMAFAYDHPTTASPDQSIEESLFAVMTVNNETGAILQAPGSGGKVLRDATQALAKVPIELGDYVAFSAHKLYGPKGVGGLYQQEPLHEPSQRGGQQEQAQRAGTLNVPAIVGFGAACAIAEQEMEMDYRKAEECRGVVLESLKSLSDWQTNDSANQSPFVLSLSFAGIEGETLVVDLDAKGFAISAGAACSSRSTEPSFVLTALGLEETLRRGTVRISFGRFNTLESAAELGANLLLSVQKLRTMR